MGRILPQLGAAHQWRHRRMGLEPLQQLVRPLALLHQGRHLADHAQRQRIPVGVEKRAAVHGLGDRAQVLERDAFVAGQAKAILDDRRVQAQHFLDPQG